MNALNIQEDYYFELLELVSELENDFLSLESDIEHKSADDTLISSIKRSLHSLKGNSGMLGLSGLESVFHKMETQFIAQENDSSYNTDHFIKDIDFIKKYMETSDDKMILEILSNNEVVSAPSSSVKENVSAPDTISEKNTMNRLNVYHLDDEEDILVAMADVLEDYGHQVFSFSNSQKLKDSLMRKGSHLSTGQPDLFILDYRIQGPNGNTIINALNSILPNIPKVLLTGYADKDIIYESVNRGVIGVLEKPIDTYYLEKILKRAKKIKHQNVLNKKVYDLTLRKSSLSKKDLDKELNEIGKLISKII